MGRIEQRQLRLDRDRGRVQGGTLSQWAGSIVSTEAGLVDNVNGMGHRDAPGFRPTMFEQLPITRLRAAKAAFTVRRVPFGSSDYDWSDSTLLTGAIGPRSGDLVLATVSRIGLHERIELPDGRRAQLRPGDEIIVSYGDRYAPDAFEAEIPNDLGPTHLVASGGIASTVVSRHQVTRSPTEIIPVGLIGTGWGAPLNIAEFALKVEEPNRPRPPTIAVLGTSMNAGKTTAVGALIAGLHNSGEQAGGTKVTGTGSGADYWTMIDAGAHCVADFTDAGLASTYRVPYDIVEANLVRLIDHLTNEGCSAIVVEVADGLFQQETSKLIRSEVFRSYIDAVVFAAVDAVGAVGGAHLVRQLGLPLVAISGAFTRSPLSVREVQAQTDVQVLLKADLSSGPTASMLLKSFSPVVDLRRDEGFIVPIAGDQGTTDQRANVS